MKTSYIAIVGLALFAGLIGYCTWAYANAPFTSVARLSTPRSVTETSVTPTASTNPNASSTLGYYDNGKVTTWYGQSFASDPITFTVIKNPFGEETEYAKDKNYIYFDGSPLIKDRGLHNLLGVDPGTFKLFFNSSGTPERYMEDKNRVYYATIAELAIFSVVQGADPSTFVPLFDGSVYGKDTGHVYSYGILIPNADPATFNEILLSPGNPSGYSKDKNSVYYYDDTLAGPPTPIVVSGADPNTFMVNGNEYSSYDASDKNQEYLQGKIVH